MGPISVPAFNASSTTSVFMRAMTASTKRSWIPSVTISRLDAVQRWPDWKKAPLTATDTAVVNIVWDFAGFLPPVDNLPTVNTAKAGRVVPISFSLDGDQSLAILAAGSPSSRTIACDSGDELDPIEETMTAGASGLTYDAATDTYTYAWKTSKGWAETCRQLTVTLADGTVHEAAFHFAR